MHALENVAEGMDSKHSVELHSSTIFKAAQKRPVLIGIIPQQLTYHEQTLVDAVFIISKEAVGINPVRSSPHCTEVGSEWHSRRSQATRTDNVHRAIDLCAELRIQQEFIQIHAAAGQAGHHNASVDILLRMGVIDPAIKDVSERVGGVDWSFTGIRLIAAEHDIAPARKL